MRQSLPSLVDTEAMQITSASDTCQVMYKHNMRPHLLVLLWDTENLSICQYVANDVDNINIGNIMLYFCIEYPLWYWVTLTFTLLPLFILDIVRVFIYGCVCHCAFMRLGVLFIDVGDNSINGSWIDRNMYWYAWNILTKNSDIFPNINLCHLLLFEIILYTYICYLSDLLLTLRMGAAAKNGSFTTPAGKSELRGHHLMRIRGLVVWEIARLCIDILFAFLLSPPNVVSVML